MALVFNEVVSQDDFFYFRVISVSAGSVADDPAPYDDGKNFSPGNLKLMVIFNNRTQGRR